MLGKMPYTCNSGTLEAPVGGSGVQRENGEDCVHVSKCVLAFTFLLVFSLLKAEPLSHPSLCLVLVTEALCEDLTMQVSFRSLLSPAA